ncbi:MAG: S-layer homology domain-containing protein [Chloroflexota bacterium]
MTDQTKRSGSWHIISLLILMTGLLVTGSVALAGAPTSIPGQGEVTTPSRVQASRSTDSSHRPGVWNPAAPITFVLDDGTQENSVGLNNGTMSFPAIWLNRFMPANGDFPLTLNQISIQFPSAADAGRNLVGLTVDLLVYIDADRNNDPANAVKLAQVPVTITVADGTTFDNFPVNIVSAAPGDLYIGFADTYNSGGVTPISFPAPLDTTLPHQVRSWVAGQSTSADPDYNNLANNDTLGTIDSLGLPGNWVIRASGDTLTGGTPTSTGTSVLPTSTSTAIATSTSTVVATTTATISLDTPTATATACAITFADVLPGNTFYPFITCLACRGIINGYPCGGPGEPCNTTNEPYFRPSNNLTRGQVTKIVAESAGLTGAPTGQSFEDVLPGTTFYTYTERLFSIGAIGGYPCGGVGEPCVSPGNRPYYRPGVDVTRGQITKIVSTAAGFTDPAPTTNTFADVPVGSTFHVYVERLLLNRPGVMSGYPCGGPGEPCDPQQRPYFRPNATLSRGQASKIVSNTFFPNCQPVGRINTKK